MRIRLPYSNEEKMMLLEIIKLYPIIEKKDYDNTTIKKKKEAWAKVRDTFNDNIALTTGSRSVLQLKRCWDKTKRRKKELEDNPNHNKKGLVTKHKTILNNEVPNNLEDTESDVPHFKVEVLNNFNEEDAHQDQQASNEPPRQCRNLSPEQMESSTGLLSRLEGHKQTHVDWVEQKQYENVVAQNRRDEELHKINLETAEIRKQIAMVELEIMKKKLDQL